LIHQALEGSLWTLVADTKGRTKNYSRRRVFQSINIVREAISSAPEENKNIAFVLNPSASNAPPSSGPKIPHAHDGAANHVVPQAG
jgi:hypothetical protein